MDSGAHDATREFLERRFARDPQGGYRAHQPIGGLDGSGEPGQLLRLARTYRLLRWVTALRPESVLDLGAAEGYIGNLLGLRVGCPVLCSDLSLEACKRAVEIYGLPAIAGDLSCLLLLPRCADVVLLSEVFEHLHDPRAALSAALGYARRYLVLTTQELCASRAEQAMRRALCDWAAPHSERNWLTRSDLRALFGDRVAMVPEFRRSRRRLLGDMPRTQWADHVEWLADPSSWRTSEGVIAVISVDGSPIPPFPSGDDPVLLRMLVEGPQRADSSDISVWSWLEGVAPPGGDVLDARDWIPQQVPRVRTELGTPHASDTFRRIHAEPESAPAWLRKAYARLIPQMERIGYLTCDDPLAVKLRWLRRLPLAGDG